MILKESCQALVISCIDYRFQDYIDNWLHEHFESHQWDRVALAGGVYDFYTILKQIEISFTLHNITKVILINHEDCGAYGEAGTLERHRNDLVEAERKIEALFQKLDVETYLLHLDGDFEEVSRTKPRFAQT